MVTVVKPQETRQVQCYHCKSVLEYVFTEIQTKVVVDYGGGRYAHRFIKCPVCSHDVGVK